MGIENLLWGVRAHEPMVDTETGKVIIGIRSAGKLNLATEEGIKAHNNILAHKQAHRSLSGMIENVEKNPNKYYEHALVSALAAVLDTNIELPKNLKRSHISVDIGGEKRRRIRR